MTDNKKILETFLKTDENYLEENYYLDIEDTLKDLDHYVKLISEFNDICKEFEKGDSIKRLRDISNSTYKKKSVLSYSYFGKWLNTKNLTLSILNEVSDEELENLVLMYKEIATRTNQELIEYLTQGLYFSKASQTRGAAYIPKIRKQYINAGYREANSLSQLKEGHFTLLDSLIMDYIRELDFVFEWSVEHDGKKPDFLHIDKEGNIFIGEHKNLKEVGGAQDKQINEIISLIKYDYSSKGIYFVSYCDGVYFNRISEKTAGKFVTQIKNIKNNVENTCNYFVNTKGFEELLND